MFRFTSASLRKVLTLPSDLNKPITLENGYGFYIRAEDEKQPGYMNMAYAEGFDPRRDSGWEEKISELLPGIDYSFTFFISHTTRQAILNEHHDFFVTPLISTVRSETRPPEKVFIPVAEFRKPYASTRQKMLSGWPCYWQRLSWGLKLRVVTSWALSI